MNNERLTRREFIKDLALIGIGLKVSSGAAYLLYKATETTHEDYDPDLKIHLDTNPEISLWEGEQLTSRLSKLREKLGPMEVDITNTEAWVREIYPQFDFNGLTTNLRSGVDVVPTRFRGGDLFNGVYGYTYCQREVSLNDRMFNPESAWNAQPENLQVLTHELAHEVQGYEMCNSDLFEDRLEESAQIASWEVMASMVLEGNRPMLHALVSSLERAAFRASLYVALKKHQLPWFTKRFRQIVGEERFSLWDRMRRASMSDMGGHYSILERYAYNPLKTILEARKTSWEVTGLSLPVKQSFAGRAVYPVSPKRPPFKLDDLRYFFSRMEAL